MTEETQQRILCFFSPTLPHKGMILGRIVEDKMCVLIFSTTLSETFFILRRIQRDIVINVHRSLWKVPFIVVRF